MGILDGLLGSFSPPSTAPQMSGLLGQFYDPKEMKRQQMKQMLLGAGIGLLSQQGRVGAPITWGESLGDALRGGMQGAQNAEQSYMDNAKMAYEMDRNAKDDTWKATEREHQLTEWQRAEAERKRREQARETYLKANPAYRPIAEATPEKFDAWLAETVLPKNAVSQEELAWRAEEEKKMTPEQVAMARRVPEVFWPKYTEEVLGKQFPKAQEPFTLGEGQTRFDATGKPIATGGEKKKEPPAAVQEYEYALEQLRKRGVPEDKLPTFQEFAKPKSRGIVFTNPDGTTVQIGGSADSTGLDGTSIPGELGARIGLGQLFLQRDVPVIEESIKAGDATGPYDYIKGQFGRGASGEVQRRMASGVDALRRNLTGAGMSASEASDYAQRYLPTITDDAETLSRKLEGLKADLEAVASGAIKGKAGKVSDLMPGAPISQTGQAPDVSKMTDEELKAILNGQ